MKIEQLLPSAEDWKRLQDIESILLRRRTASTLAGAIAIVSAALQVVFAIADKGYFDKLLTILGSLITLRFDELARIGLDRKTAITWGVLLIAAIAYFLLRRTSVLLKESKEAFRYTFWIEPFEAVEKTPGDRLKLDAGDRFLQQLLHHDLMERLDERFQRFSLLKESPSGGGGERAKTLDSSRRLNSSHIQITGHYAFREEGDDPWVVHVMPVVRIGPAGSPAALAQSVKYPFAKQDQASRDTAPPGEAVPSAPATARLTIIINKLIAPPGEAVPSAPATGDGTAGHTLKASEYEDIVERVYSSIATEVYRRIESDVREKIALFPTAHLRAVALYHEAEDFARSNTVDAYEQAIALYREALRYFDLNTIRFLTRLLLRVPVLWRTEVNYQHEYARIVAGYAKCLIYRREISEQSGRKSNPLYELPEILGEAIEPLKRLQKQIGRRSADSRLERILAYLMYPRDSWLDLLPIFGRPSPLFQAQKDALFELYLVDALTKCFLGRGDEAEEGLKDAAATAPDQVTKNPLYLMAQGLMEPVVVKAILRFQQAVDLDPKFQIARWYLASSREKVLRQRDEITRKQAQVVLDEYGEVLKLNYGNIQALSAQGYLLWLIEHSPGDGSRPGVGAEVSGQERRARQCLEQGKQVKAIARETFTGELNYRLARTFAESAEFEKCRVLYSEAIEADPAFGAIASDPLSRVRGVDFEDIGLSVLRRFETFKATVESKIDDERKKRDDPKPTPVIDGKTKKSDDPKPVAEKTLRVVHGFVLNDYATALLSYFYYHGDHSYSRACPRRLPEGNGSESS